MRLLSALALKDRATAQDWSQGQVDLMTRKKHIAVLFSGQLVT